MSGLRLFICALAAVMAAGASRCEALLRNGGFESVDGGVLEGWSSLRPPLSVDKSSGRNGGNALAFCAEFKPEHTVLSQTFPVMPGRSYRASLWAKTENLTGGRAMVCIEWYNEAGRWAGGVYSQGIGGTEDWTEINAVASRLPETAKTFRVGVYVERGGCGRAWFDDVSLTPVETPVVAGLYSSAYRNQAAVGDVTFFADLNLASGGISPDQVKAIFSLPFAEGRKTVVADAISNNWASVTVDASELKTGTVGFRLMDSSGRRFNDTAIRFERLEGENRKGVRVDRHNRLLVDGKPFFPVGMYFGKVNSEDLEVYSKGPFNCLMPYARITREQLDMCADRGLKAFCNIKDYYTFTRRGRPTREENDEVVRKIAEELKGHPALLGWYLNDEIPPAYINELKGRYELMKTLDPDRPTWTMLYQVRQMREYLPSFDICGSDPYPHEDWKRWNDAYTWPRIQIADTFRSRPVWQAIQAHDSAAYKTGSREELMKTHSTGEAEVRSLAWQALTAGANGFFFYSFFDLKKMDWKTPFKESFGGVCRVAEELRRYEHVFLSTDPVEAVVDSPHIGVRGWRYGGKVYLAVANQRHSRTHGSVSVDVPFSAAETLLGDRPLKGLEFDFAPFGISFVRLTPSAAANSSVKADGRRK